MITQSLRMITQSLSVIICLLHIIIINTIFCSSFYFLWNDSNWTIFIFVSLVLFYSLYYMKLCMSSCCEEKTFKQYFTIRIRSPVPFDSIQFEFKSIFFLLFHQQTHKSRHFYRIKRIGKFTGKSKRFTLSSFTVISSSIRFWHTLIHTHTRIQHQFNILALFFLLHILKI